MTAPMTAEELLKLAEKASPGPWEAVETDDLAYSTILGPDIKSDCYADWFSVEDASFIVAAHNHAPRIIREQQAEIARLKAQVKAEQAEYMALRDDRDYIIEARDSEIERLKKALGPFAESIGPTDNWRDDNQPIIQGDPVQLGSLTIGHFRAAARAIKGGE